MEQKIKVIRYTDSKGQQAVIQDSLTERVYSVDQYLRAREQGRKLDFGPSPIERVASLIANMQSFCDMASAYGFPDILNVSNAVVGIDFASDHSADMTFETTVVDGRVTNVRVAPPIQ